MPIRAADGPANRRRGGARLALVLVGLATAGCGRATRQITPTTLGTDFSRLPRGQMKPFPWPGQSIVRSSTRQPGPMIDPAAATAAAEAPSR